jgi:hypothetical protein
MIYFDTESVGLHGMTVLIQYAEDDGPIILHEVWKEPVHKTLRLIEWFCENEVCLFNATFDWFHINKLYNIFRLIASDWIPEEHIEAIVSVEADARDGVAVKPKACLDLMLFARKGPLQVLMNRKDIRIKRIPDILALPLAKELDKRLHFDPIFFAKRKKYQEGQWQVEDGKNKPGFKDVVLKFKPSVRLKDLAKHVLKIEDLNLYKDVGVASHFNPAECGWSPFAASMKGYSSPKTKGKKPWPQVIKYFIKHWHTHKEGRTYAEMDVELLRLLRVHFGNPPAGDDDSELACMVGATRWKGYTVDIEKIKKLREDILYKAQSAPTAPSHVWEWLKPVMSEFEILAMEGTTNKAALTDLSRLTITCPECKGTNQREIDTIRVKCDCVKGQVRHPAAIRASTILEARTAKKEVKDLYDKLIQAGRMHADFNIIGAKSSRMSGASQLNAQAINKEKRVRECFTLAHSGQELDGGDFESFEVVILIAVYQDHEMQKQLQELRDCHKCETTGQCYECFDCAGKGKIKDKITGKTFTCDKCDGKRVLTTLNLCHNCKGKLKVETKIHAIIGQQFYPQFTYEEIVDSSGTDQDYYTKSKSGFFAWIYGGTEYTLSKKLDVGKAYGKAAMESIGKRFKITGQRRNQVVKMFEAMTQEQAYGKIEWKEPADYIEEPILGHRRYFTLENQTRKTLFELAEKPPEEWQKLQMEVQRRINGPAQKVSGAVQSALFGAAFQIQGQVQRAAQNHEIQSAGAKITKHVQRKIWELQPSGIHPFVVMPLNCHDELMVPHNPKYKEQLKQVVDETINHFKERVPLLSIDWKSKMGSWAEK